MRIEIMFSYNGLDTLEPYKGKVDYPTGCSKLS